ncbi:glutaredoxin family protein [Aquibacillus albus]|uniref:Arsenate reductase-like glutaredoxin family protein n=1 Tax=Aquibacillus albus TaxID=1168171 RepID=A0ABS2MZ01_9BACI|nr:glutaredoxin family protein [Aquibacillus albus]MBM7571090.1 arsenate reductase-like glutaredoxin family protein [Aquibacillus albus]
MKQEEVVVYVSDSCKECEKVLSWLDEQNISYTKKNTTKNKEYLKELQKERVYATPAIFTKKYKILGFQKSKLINALIFS